MQQSGIHCAYPGWKPLPPVIHLNHHRPLTSHRLPTNTSTAAAAAATRTLQPTAAALEIRTATTNDYWPISDMHCAAFYPRATPFWNGLLRLDRVLSLHVGSERQGPALGQFICLIAEDEERKGRLNQVERGGLNPVVDAVVKRLFPPSYQENYCASHLASGLQGAVVLDTLADHLPPKRIEYNGVIREIRRQGIGYISNLAVSPSAQRKGIGMKLLHQAEALAKDWGCRSVALHVDPSNTPAVELYKSAGYKVVSRQPEWQRFIEGRPHALVLMLRVLPKKGKLVG